MKVTVLPLQNLHREAKSEHSSILRNSFSILPDYTALSGCMPRSRRRFLSAMKCLFFSITDVN